MRLQRIDIKPGDPLPANYWVRDILRVGDIVDPEEAGWGFRKGRWAAGRPAPGRDCGTVEYFVEVK